MRFIKFLIALLLLPLAFFASLEMARILLEVLGHFKAGIGFWLGVVCYGATHYSVYNFSRPYVFMHEATHALAAFVCGSRIKDISVGRDSGYVKMTKSNTFIVLAPYFVPGYVLLTAFCYLVGDLFTDLTPYRPVFLFLIGFFTAFHFVQTFKTLFEADQPDLKLAGGKVFSVTVITLANLAVLAVVLKSLFPGAVSLRPAGGRVITDTLAAWRILVNYIIRVITKQ
ncbi:MAG: M50 family metallopeptidase [Elusimicrobiaceae bacterium]|nr:M50 family metallopeptidase [Elusimicrobiaceae bacterium]